MKWFALAAMALVIASCEDGTRRIYPNNDDNTGTADTDGSGGDDLFPDDLNDAIVEAVTDETAIDDAVTDDAVTDDPVTDDPVTDDTLTDDAVTDDTVTDDTVTDDTVTDDTVTDDTVTDDTVTDDTVTDDTVTDDGAIQPDIDMVVTDDGTIHPDIDMVITDDGTIPDADVDTCVCSTGLCCDGCHYRSGNICRAAADPVCDVPEYCPGDSADCPADGFASNETVCDDENFCNGDDTCNGNGGCTTHAGPPCGNFVCSEDQDKCCDPGWAGADCEICVRFVSPPGVIPVAGDGLSWAMAFNDIQPAIDSANNASAATCEVWVAAGVFYVYKTATTNNIQLHGKAPLYGGFAGAEWLREARDPRNNVTVIDGRQSDGGTNRVAHIMFGEDGALVDGFTVQEGRAITGSSSNIVEGAGLYLSGGSMTVRNCVFAHNSAPAQTGDDTARGGAITAINGANLTIENCDFSANTVTAGTNDVAFGGAIYQVGGTSTIARSIFRNNTVSGGTYETGGGAVNIFTSTNLAISDSLFYGNTAPLSGTVHGGAIRANNAGTLSIINTTFSKNAGDEGGAIANLGSTTTTIVNSIFWGNTASHTWNNTREFWDDNNGSGPITATYSDIQMTDDSVFPGAGNINADPLFVNAGNNDFHLTADAGSMQISPCIDSANDASAPPIDLEGKSRFDVPMYGTGIADMGCYEFVY